MTIEELYNLLYDYESQSGQVPTALILTELDYRMLRMDRDQYAAFSIQGPPTIFGLPYTVDRSPTAKFRIL